MIFVSHVTCTTGQILPLADIGRLAAERQLWFAVDGAQSLAQFPIDIGATGAHCYAASCHKWLMGPKRTGILYVRKDRLPDLASAVVGAYSDRTTSLADRQLTLRADADRFEYGTQNDALIYGIETAADLVAALGLAADLGVQPGDGRAVSDGAPGAGAGGAAVSRPSPRRGPPW